MQTSPSAVLKIFIKNHLTKRKINSAKTISNSQQRTGIIYKTFLIFSFFKYCFCFSSHKHNCKRSGKSYFSKKTLFSIINSLKTERKICFSNDGLIIMIKKIYYQKFSPTNFWVKRQHKHLTLQAYKRRRRVVECVCVWNYRYLEVTLFLRCEEKINSLNKPFLRPLSLKLPSCSDKNLWQNRRKLVSERSPNAFRD